MSFFAKAQIIKTFFLPKFLQFARLSPFGRNLEQDFQKLSLKVLWGNGKRSEVSLQHLQRERLNRGIDWPNLRCHVVAAKLVDIREAMRSNDVLTKNKIENANKNKNIPY